MRDYDNIVAGVEELQRYGTIKKMSPRRARNISLKEEKMLSRYR
jgi:hypothetical protein